MTRLRPVVLINGICKILSLILLERFRPYAKSYIPSSQAGFCKGRSCTDIIFAKHLLCSTAIMYEVDVHFLCLDLSMAFDTPTRDLILESIQIACDNNEDIVHIDKWYKALDSKKYVEVVFLDISKAFDALNHDLPMSKLSHLGLSSSSLSWFKSYLSNCLHVTRVAKFYSSLGFPCSGIPGNQEGSILGPTLFSASINDLPSVLPPDPTVLFADNTTIFIISNNLPSLNSTLRLTLDLSNLWL